MNLKEAVTVAARALRTNRLRSALTTLGIVIGVTAVIVLIGLGNGMKAAFAEGFGQLATAIIVNKVQGSVPGGGQAKDLKMADVEALYDKARAPDVAMVIPVIQGEALATKDNGIHRTKIAGSTTDYMRVTNRAPLLGSIFTEEHERASARVVVLGVNVVASLFGGDAGRAVGSNIRIGRATFKVIGVLKKDSYNDDVALMPLSTARANLVGGDAVHMIAIKATDVASVPAAVDQITRILSERHHIRDPAKRDFDIQAMQSQVDEINQFMMFLNLFIVAVGGISLIVGAIGVANIMLVSVTERTHEIGIRKAIGAPRGAIMKQFLIESVMLAGMGGLVGVVVGVGITLIAAVIMPRMVPDFGAPEVSVWAILMSFGVSLLVGLVAGGYPARRAARLQPVEALRYQ
ncbi:ABC transporter permease [Pseudonocardia acaciae]|uniref:ABC transporter permease n=1 Tax=Pseudonocardia acaciae TaxID=551276 RepID=UPI000491A54C|nr:ABC transporter permease [Pseudonocardia acaciae]